LPTKRTRTPRPLQRRITPDAIEAFKAGDALALERALGIKPWEVNPLDASGPAPDWEDAASWAEATALREALEEAADAQ
jgi:hypothetical protein